jgi:hypothetical protein
MYLPNQMRGAWRGGYFVVPYAPPKPHEQRMTLLQPMRDATCEEVFCTWYALGAEGTDEGAPFKHPKGARCGDFSGCLPCQRPEAVTGKNGLTRKKPCGDCPPCKSGTANCPCTDRKHRLPNVVEYEDRVIDPVARANYRPQPIRHGRVIRQGGEVISREVTGDEFKHRINEGLDARNHVLTRGI